MKGSEHLRTDPHSIEEARIFACSLVVADRLRINAEPVLAIARETVERWGWTQRNPAEQPAYDGTGSHCSRVRSPRSSRFWKRRSMTSAVCICDRPSRSPVS